MGGMGEWNVEWKPTSACAPSRATAERRSSRGAEGSADEVFSGLGSLASRRPRSNV